ncbi:hypothetical protein Tco_1317107 [Tanacetum coccineum]
MADQRYTMEDISPCFSTEGYAEAIVVPPIPAEHFELKHSLINLVTSKQFFSFEDPYAHIRYFNKITSTLKYKDMPEASIKLMLFPFSIDGPARIWLDKEPPHSILAWDDLVSNEAWERFKDLLRACPHHGFTELHQLDTFYNGLNPSNQDSLNSAAGGNLLERSVPDVLKIIENKSKVRNSRNKPIVSQVKTSNVDSSEIASVIASAVTSAMTAMFKQHQVTPAPASIKAVEEYCLGSLPCNTIANDGEVKAFTATKWYCFRWTSVPMPPLFINPEEEERVEETLTDPELVEYTIKVIPLICQNLKLLQKFYEMPKGISSP